MGRVRIMSSLPNEFILLFCCVQCFIYTYIYIYTRLYWSMLSGYSNNLLNFKTYRYDYSMQFPSVVIILYFVPYSGLCFPFTGKGTSTISIIPVSYSRIS